MDTLLNKIHCGDALETLRGIPDEMFDSVVTDPPYGWSMMGKGWDADVPTEALWAEVLRVSKAGAHLLAFCGTRTYHRMATRIEDGGWEIREVVTWLHGQGFPKSLDIGKAIDRELGLEREVLGVSDRRGSGFVRHGRTDEEVFFVNDSRRTPALLTKPASEAGQAWDGWGSGLKPAVEFVCLARKPLSESSIARNVLKHGTGGLNIDACRIGVERMKTNGVRNGMGISLNLSNYESPADFEGATHVGRFPANVVHDGSEEVEAAFARFEEPDNVGSPSRFFYTGKATREEREFGLSQLPASKHGIRNVHTTVKPLALMRWLVRLVTRRDGLVLDPFAGSGTTLLAAKLEGMRWCGIERESEYAAIAAARVAAYDAVQETLF